MKYTPGPWGYTGRSETGHVGSIFIYSKNPKCKRRTCIGEVYDDDEPQSIEANTRRITAAPEMVELLEEAIQAIWGKGKYIFTSEKIELTDHIKGLLHHIKGEEDPK